MVKQNSHRTAVKLHLRMLFAGSFQIRLIVSCRGRLKQSETFVRLRYYSVSVGPSRCCGFPGAFSDLILKVAAKKWSLILQGDWGFLNPVEVKVTAACSM